MAPQKAHRHANQLRLLGTKAQPHPGGGACRSKSRWAAAAPRLGPGARLHGQRLHGHGGVWRLVWCAEDGFTLGGIMPSHARAQATWRSGPKWSSGRGSLCREAVGPEGHVVPDNTTETNRCSCLLEYAWKCCHMWSPKPTCSSWSRGCGLVPREDETGLQGRFSQARPEMVAGRGLGQK